MSKNLSIGKYEIKIIKQHVVYNEHVLLPARECLHRRCAVTLYPGCPIVLRSSTAASEIKGKQFNSQKG